MCDLAKNDSTGNTLLFKSSKNSVVFKKKKGKKLGKNTQTKKQPTLGSSNSY